MTSPISESPPEPATETPVSLVSLFGVFFQIGAFSFGGGLSAWVYREVVLTRPWLTNEEYLSYMALSQILPGANVTNLAVCIGLKVRGFVGACTALFALLLVPFFAVIVLLLLYDRISSIGWLPPALSGITAAALGLLIFTSWKGGQSATRNLPAAIALIVTFVMVGILHWPLLPVVLGVGTLSVAAAWPRKKRDA